MRTRIVPALAPLVAAAALAGAPQDGIRPVRGGVLPPPPRAEVRVTLLLDYGGCGGNEPPIPLPGARVVVRAGAREIDRALTDGDGRAGLAVPAGFPVDLVAYAPMDYPIGYAGIVAPRDFRIALADLVVRLRFEPRLVGVRFSPETSDLRAAEILSRCALSPEGRDPDDPFRWLARAAEGDHVTDAVRRLLSHAPEVTEALPGRFYPGCSP